MAVRPSSPRSNLRTIPDVILSEQLAIIPCRLPLDVWERDTYQLHRGQPIAVTLRAAPHAPPDLAADGVEVGWLEIASSKVLP